MTPAPRTRVARSPVHGTGLFAGRDLRKGTEVIEYLGRVLSWEEADARHAAAGSPTHVCLFDLNDGTVIDGGDGGNDARFLNHNCEPNCEAYEVDGRIVVYTTRAVRAGAELFIDYRLALDNPTDDQRAAYRCACDAPTCRGTMLA